MRVHSGYDRVVHWSQSENMKELLRGVGVEDVKSRIYTTGHTGVLTGKRSAIWDKMTCCQSFYRIDES